MLRLLLSGWMIQVLMKLHLMQLLEFPVVVSNSKYNVAVFLRPWEYRLPKRVPPFDCCRLFDFPAISCSVVGWNSVFRAV